MTTTETTTIKPRKRGRWWKVLLVVVVLLLVLVALGPTLLSTGPGRNLIVGQINNRIAGKVGMESLSLGWFSPIKVGGLTISDPDGKLITRVDTLETGLTILGALGSNIDAGDVNVRVGETQLISYEDGRTNLQRALASRTPAEAGGTASESKPTLVKANVGLLTGKTTWQSPGNPIITIDTLTAKAKLDTAGGPLNFSANTAVRTGEGRPAGISANGDMNVFSNGGLKSPKEMTGNGDATITSLDLATITPLLNALGVQLQTSGTLNSKMIFKAENGGVTLTGENTIEQFAASGAMLKGDTLRSRRVVMPVNMTTQGDVLRFDNTKVEADFASIDIKGDTTMQALQALGGKSVSGIKDSNLVLTGQANVKALADQLPKTMALREGTTLDRGVATLNGHVKATGGMVDAALAATLNDVEGAQAGRRIALEPVNVNVSAKPTSGKLVIAAAALMPPSGETVNITARPQDNGLVKLGGSYNLDRLTAQVGQFVDLGDKRFAGQGTLDGEFGSADGIVTVILMTKIERFQALMAKGASQIPPTLVNVDLWATVDTNKQIITITKDSTIQEIDRDGGNKIHLPKGTTYAYGKSGQINVDATIDYDLARITALAGPFLPEGTAMAGKRSMKLKLTGALADGDGLKKFRGLKLEPTSFSYDRIKLKGVDLTKGDIALKMEKGVMPLGPSQLAANGGSFNLVGRVDLNQDPPAFILEKSNVPYSVVSNFGLNQEVAGGPLRFLPMTWGASGKDLNLLNVDGLVSLDITDAYLPLDYEAMKRKGTMNARINIDKLRTDAPIFRQLTGMVGGLLQLGNKGLPLIEGDIRNITLVMKDGRVFYDNFTLGADFGRMNFSGSVGLDQSLSMNVDVGTKQLNVPIPIGLGGTTSKPVPTVSDKFTKDLGGLLKGVTGGGDAKDVGKNVEKGLQDVGKGLEGLFKKPKPEDEKK